MAERRPWAKIVENASLKTYPAARPHPAVGRRRNPPEKTSIEIRGGARSGALPRRTFARGRPRHHRRRRPPGPPRRRGPGRPRRGHIRKDPRPPSRLSCRRRRAVAAGTVPGKSPGSVMQLSQAANFLVACDRGEQPAPTIGSLSAAPLAPPYWLTRRTSPPAPEAASPNSSPCSSAGACTLSRRRSRSPGRRRSLSRRRRRRRSRPPTDRC